MTVSELHEDIVDDIRFDVRGNLHKSNPDYVMVVFTPESWLANSFLGIRERTIRADVYIFPPYKIDPYGVIMVEVGRNTHENKWENWISEDKKPVRVIHVDFQRNASLIHPRHTKFESDLMRVMRDTLEHLKNNAIAAK